MIKNNILLILTGGTICSFSDNDENGERNSDTERAQTLIVENFRKSSSPFRDEERVTFDAQSPLDILSENMTVTHWNTLIDALKSYDYSKYDGVIILHGTDTLAYTASLLSMLMAGTPIPVFLVSSQLPLTDPEANGNENFRAAVELTVRGIRPNVYAIYGNEELSEEGTVRRTTYLHYGAHLLQCPNYSNNFYSIDSIPFDVENNLPYVKEPPICEMPLYSCGRLSNCVMRISPYVGIDYDRFSLTGVKAILHGTYHSCTMAVNPYVKDPSAEEEQTLDYTSDSVMSLKRRCDEAGISLFIEPCDREDYKTTGIVLRGGARALYGLTTEMAYVKLLLGCAAGLCGEELFKYVTTEINGEFFD